LFSEEDSTAFAVAVNEKMAEKRFQEIREMLSAVPAVDVAVLLSEIDEKNIPLLYRILPKEMAADVFAELDADAQERLIACFSDRELREVLEELYLDDTVAMIEEMPASVVARILRNSSAESRAQINSILRYPKDSAGSLMTTEFVRLKKSMTVKEAFETIRRDAIDKETIYTCYVTNENRKLEGVVSVKSMLLASLSATIASVMEENVVYAQTLADREDVAKMFDHYNFLALPVVDNEQRLVGIITVDDAMDVLQEEAEEDFTKMAAITPSETPYLKTGVFTIFKTRFPWLLILMLSATFTGLIISGFETALSSCVVLTAFIPMLMGTGGNSGSQASVTVIRGISLGEITFRDAWRVLFKELRVSLLCSVVLALVSFIKIMLVDRLLLGNPDVTPMVAFTVSATLTVTVIAAKLIGAALPILAKRMKLDPAVMASPFITTIVDALSLLVYFCIAQTLLGL